MKRVIAYLNKLNRSFPVWIALVTVLLFILMFALLWQTDKESDCVETIWGNVLITKVDYLILGTSYQYGGVCK